LGSRMFSLLSLKLSKVAFRFFFISELEALLSAFSVLTWLYMPFPLSRFVRVSLELLGSAKWDRCELVWFRLLFCPDSSLDFVFSVSVVVSRFFELFTLGEFPAGCFFSELICSFSFSFSDIS